MFWKRWITTEFRKKTEKTGHECALGGDIKTRSAHKKWKKAEILVDETVLLGYNVSIGHKK